jgi:hypothetical protein
MKPCQNKYPHLNFQRKSKSLSANSGIGRNSKGWHYGAKMTVVRDAGGNLLGLRFTQPRKNDRSIFRSIIA